MSDWGGLYEAGLELETKELRAENERQRAEIERLRQDAERYRWLRNDALQVLVEGPINAVHKCLTLRIFCRTINPRCTMRRGEMK